MTIDQIEDLAAERHMVHTLTTITDSERHLIVTALRHAAEVYENDAQAVGELRAYPNPRLVVQFREQASVARKLADSLENR